MKHIFYAMTAFPILWEMSNLYGARKNHKLRQEWKALQEAKGIDALPKEAKKQVIFDLMYLFWTFTGLFTFQWPVFLMLLMLGIIPKRFVVWRSTALHKC